MSLKDKLAEINKKYKDNVAKMADTVDTSVQRMTSGSLLLDRALGGGYYKGKMVELYGAHSVGKSTLSLHFLSNVDGPIAYIDTENSFDTEYAERLGVDTSKLVYVQPDYLEQALDILIELSAVCEAVVFDSLAETPTYKELVGELVDKNMGDKAKVMSQFGRKLKSLNKVNNCTIIVVNQIRDKMNAMGYGPKTTTVGGWAMKFASHIQLDVRRGLAIKKGEDIIGHNIIAKVEKNKLGIPKVKVELPLIYDGHGVSKEMEVIILGLESGTLIRKGAWFSYDGSNIAQGQENLRTFLMDNPELRDEIISKINGESQELVEEKVKK